MYRVSSVIALIAVLSIATDASAANTKRVVSACGAFAVEIDKGQGETAVLFFTPESGGGRVTSMEFELVQRELLDAPGFPKPAPIQSRAKFSGAVTEDGDGQYVVEVAIQSPRAKWNHVRGSFQVSLPSGEYEEFNVEFFKAVCS